MLMLWARRYVMSAGAAAGGGTALSLFRASLCEEVEKKEEMQQRAVSQRCAKLNTALQRLMWATREERCNNVEGCEFLGGSGIGGNCVNKLGHIFKDDDEEVVGDKPLVLVGPSTPSPLSAAATGVQQLVNEQLKSSASDTLKESRDDAEKLAKSLILDASNKPEYRHEFGRVLEYIFSFESVQKPTRDLVWWSVKSPMSMHEIEGQALWWRRYFLNSTFPPISHRGSPGEGFTYTEEQLTTLLAWWLSTPHAKSVVNPLLIWTLREKVVVDSVVQIVIDALPYCTPYWKLCAKDAIKLSLQSPELKVAARDSLFYLLKNVGESPLATNPHPPKK